MIIAPEATNAAVLIHNAILFTLKINIKPVITAMTKTVMIDFFLSLCFFVSDNGLFGCTIGANKIMLTTENTHPNAEKQIYKFAGK